MNRFFVAYGKFVGNRPRVALAIVVAITAVAMYGASLTAEQADQEDSFLPSGSALIAAQNDLGESFPQFSSLQTLQVVLRGPVLSPDGASDSRVVTNAVATDADLAPFVVSSRPVTSPGHVLSAMIAGPGGDPALVDLGSLDQADIDAALAEPANAKLVSALEGLVARDATGAIVGGIGVFTVNENDDLEALANAQINVDQVAKDIELTGLDSARTFSTGKLAEDSDASAALAVLMLFALAVIAVLLWIFYRQISDLLLSLGGLILTIIWATGFQGLLGPDGFGMIGAPSVMSSMVPIMMIGLCVDYGIQLTSRYRETAAEGKDPTDGISEAVAAVWLPLGLAGGTTIISFLTNLLGDIGGMADFGVVAGIGVASGLFIFLTGVPAVRVLLDRRNEAKGRAMTSRPMSDAIPGAGKLVEAISSVSVAKPGVILAAVGVFTIVMGGLASQVESEFSNEDFVANGSESKEDLAFLNEFLGGNTEPVTILVESEMSSDRTLRNLLDLSAGIEDPVQRPTAVASEVTSSLGVLFESLPAATQAELNNLNIGSSNPLVVPADIIDQSLDIMEAADPEGFASVISYGTDGETDRTIVQFDAFTGETEATVASVEDIDGLWLGEDEDITAISGLIIGLEITDSLTSSQVTSIIYTVLAASVILMLFFWATEFRPMLALLAVLPIVLVLIWVLGTMFILGYNYNVITAMITALSIGIGVDYTIHITHRFLEEREHGSTTIADAVGNTMRTTGGALIGSALTTALGFMVMIFAPIPPMGQFGLLTAITVGYSLIAAIVVLPPMLVIWAAYHDWRHQHLTELERVEAAAGK